MSEEELGEPQCARCDNPMEPDDVSMHPDNNVCQECWEAECAASWWVECAPLWAEVSEHGKQS